MTYWKKTPFPNCAAIYFVSNSSGQIFYIGRTVSLVERWKEHHRFNQLRKLNRKDPIRISWLTCPRDIKTLIRLEEEYIAHYQPALNWTKVVSTARRITPRSKRKPRHLTARFYLSETPNDKQPPKEGKDRSIVVVEPWEELEPMPEGEPRLMTRQFLHVDGVEVEVCDNDNGKHFIRHNVYWWIMHNKKNPDPERQSVIQNLQSAVDALPTIRWSGYRYRLETIVFSEDDVEVESILIPLAMFEDLIRDAAIRNCPHPLAEEN